MRRTTIAHISDLHLSNRAHCSNRAATESLLDRILARKVDHIVVTGDLTANGEKAEYALARTLFERAGLLRPDRLSVVIGNHDVFGGISDAEDLLGFPARLARTDYEQEVADFRRHLTECFEGCVFGSREKGFPFAKIVGPAAIIGLNSVAEYSRLKNPFGSNGRVSDGQRRKLEKILGSTALEGYLKIVLIHHHFYRPRVSFEGTLQGMWRTLEAETLRLRGSRKLIRLFAHHTVSLVLHGHIHECADYTLGGVRFLNGGGSLIGPDPEKLSINYLHCREEEVCVETVAFPRELPKTPASQLELLSSSAA